MPSGTVVVPDRQHTVISCLIKEHLSDLTQGLPRVFLVAGDSDDPAQLVAVLAGHEQVNRLSVPEILHRFQCVKTVECVRFRESTR